MSQSEPVGNSAAGSAPGSGELNPFEMVQQIERILASDPEERALSEDSMEFPVQDALALIPKRYLREIEQEEIAGETIVLSPEKLFAQLAGGKVEMPLSKLAFYIPLHLIYHAALNDESSVIIPLKKVVKAVGLHELQRRTPEHYRLYDIAVFDDPFKEGDAVFGDDTGLILEDEDDSGVILETDKEDSAVHADEAQEKIPPVQDEVAGLIMDQESDSDAGALDAVSGRSMDAEPARPSVAGAATVKIALDCIVGKLVKEPRSDLPEYDGNQQIELDLPDIISQLRCGVVVVKLADIAARLPAGIVSAGTAADPAALLSLDLKNVVEAVGTDYLKANTPAQAKDYDIDWMADPFPEPDDKPNLDLIREVKKDKKKAADKERVPLPEGGALTGSPKITIYKPAGEKDSEWDYYELPGNVNINAATAEELMLLRGVDKLLAEGILAYRSRHGAFKSVFDLFKVSGVDDVLFRQMTGMKVEQRRRHRRRRLASLLNIPPDRVADLREVANALARKSGFLGCVIGAKDGLVLAGSGVDGGAEDFCAVLPAVIGQMRHNLELAGLKLTGTISFSVNDCFYTVQGADNVILAVVHEENMVSAADFSLIRKVCKELVWLLSVRAYAGPAA